MNIKNNSSEKTLALETELIRLETRAQAIDDDINEARAEVKASRAAFINDGSAKGRLMEAERDLSALQGAADALKSQINSVETSLAKSCAADEKARKHAQALELAAQCEAAKAEAFKIAGATASAIAEGLPATAAAIFAASDVSRQLRRLLNSENAPDFSPDERRKMNDLSADDVPALKFQVYRQQSESAALHAFRELLESQTQSGFSISIPSSTKKADLSDINAFMGANVELDMMIEARQKNG